MNVQSGKMDPDPESFNVRFKDIQDQDWSCALRVSERQSWGHELSCVGFWGSPVLGWFPFPRRLFEGRGQAAACFVIGKYYRCHCIIL